MPTHVLISNVGKAHLEGFGGFEGVKKGKGEMYDYARNNNAVVFINACNQHLREMLGNYTNTVTYGLCQGTDIEGELLPSSEFVSLRWRKTPGGWHTLNASITGEYNAENILAAVATGIHFGVDADSITEAVQSYHPDNQRSQVLKMGTNTVVMDAYNANPTSMEAALKNFSTHYAKPNAVFIGEMLELGAASESEHRHILDLIHHCHFSEVVLVGKSFAALCSPAFKCFDDAESAREYIRNRNYSGFNILVKGSRGSKMEIAASGLES
jgi:UDP-N-acetylmuramoyl-tripeptide--D-alanyl-D-alanine ligase